MTDTDFLLFYPQFSSIPPLVLQETLRDANARFDSFQEDTEPARRLFTAHRLTLYARTSTPSGASAETLSSSGSGLQITGKRVGEVSVTYSPASASASDHSDLSLTVYGQQLIPLLKLHGYSRYVP